MKKRLTQFAFLVAAWNIIEIISRVEYISKKLMWLWKATAMDVSLAGNVVLLIISGAWLIYYYISRRQQASNPGTLPKGDHVQLVLVDFFPECSGADSQWVYKSKARMVFSNAESELIEVSALRWSPGPLGIPPQQPFHADTLQLEGPNGWDAEDWGNESSAIRVPAASVFRLWIGLYLDAALNPRVREREIRRRRIAEQLGILRLNIKTGGKTKEIEIRL